MAYIKKINGYVIKDEEARTAAANAVELAQTAQTTANEAATNLTLLNTKVDTGLANKQDTLVFDGTYNATSNKAATVSTVTQKIAEVIADAPEAFDTLKEIADYIASDKTSAANMSNAISKNTSDIASLKTRVSDVETTTSTHTSQISNIVDGMGQLEDAVNANAAEIQNQTITLAYDSTYEELKILKNGTVITPTV